MAVRVGRCTRGCGILSLPCTREASAGCPRLVIGKVLSHAEPGVTAVYDPHTYDAEKREALQTWARSLRALVHADTAGGDRGRDDPRNPRRSVLRCVPVPKAACD